MVQKKRNHRYYIRQKFKLAIKRVISTLSISKSKKCNTLEPYKDFFALTSPSWKEKSRKKQRMKELFKDAAKQTILERRMQKEESDPWNKFFCLTKMKKIKNGEGNFDEKSLKSENHSENGSFVGPIERVPVDR